MVEPLMTTDGHVDALTSNLPGDGGVFLPGIVGATRAVELVLRGDRICAETTLEWG
ncbi:hypothetical protein [Nocardia vaccinii]|uniref:hypothetical protein n=1 Tax=Nocardia vaccinii TaxID=1822 RepID=UPI000A9EB817|nr:hypothetical protein [Nocardia vaccinii]